MVKDRDAKVEDLSLAQRLMLVKRLLGLRSARFSILMCEDGSMHIASVVRDDGGSHSRDGDDAAVDPDDLPVLTVGSVSYRIPELLDEDDVRMGDYFG